MRAISALLLLAAACADRGPERAARGYAEALVLAYRAGDAAALGRVAGEREAARVAVLVDLKRSAGLVLESELQRFEVLAVDRSSGPDLARVRTGERWRYHDRALRPGIEVGPVFVAEMTMEYTLERGGDGAWRVGRVRTLSNEILEPAGFRPAAHGHGGVAGGETAGGPAAGGER